MTPWRDHRAEGIFWRERPGPGPVAVLLHGIGSRAGNWERLARALPEWRLFAWDAPGYGHSVPLAAEWPVARDYAGALKAGLRALGLGRVHLIGHSLGTLIAAAFARAWPADVVSLTLLSCAQGGGGAPREPLGPAYQARIDALQAKGASAFARLCP
ncbi:MAG: alpha/beta fold hydrolase [Paracoccus sp. (in: a-proteobacteria)]|nr:alpha/beta fold hydrolase [Paracoccus sp. (in: a-proteobacteria)]